MVWNFQRTFISIWRIWKYNFRLHNPKSHFDRPLQVLKMGKFSTFWSVKYTKLVGQGSNIHRLFITWQHLTKIVIFQQDPGKPICRNSNTNSDPLNCADMPSYSGLENTRCKVPDIKSYRHVVPYKFPVSVSSFSFLGRVSVFRPGLKSRFRASKLVRLSTTGWLLKIFLQKKAVTVILR